MTTTEDLMGFPVSYVKARRAKEDIFQGLYGTYEQAYDYAPRLLKQTGDANRGMVVFMKQHQNPIDANEKKNP